MEVLINELSLDGQFKDENNFFDNLHCVLKVIKIIEKVEFTLSKEYMFFQSKITNKLILSDVLKLPVGRDKIRKTKTFFIKLTQSPPFWNDDRKHNCNHNTYLYNSKNICDTSLAESCERDKIILSFEHDDYLNKNLTIQKNDNDVGIFNIINRDVFLEYLFNRKKINMLEYCRLKFKKNNLDFSNIQEKNDFSNLNTQQEKEFIESFKQFSKMKWHDIQTSDGLDYKKYSNNKVKYNNKTIYKFRVTQKYRCFGYREQDIFYVLRLETDHTMSDKG